MQEWMCSMQGWTDRPEVSMDVLDMRILILGAFDENGCTRCEIGHPRYPNCTSAELLNEGNGIRQVIWQLIH